ncbi:hypothetical protein MKK70_22970 [Methylobacterium sp. E-041]|uniref:hypothetical protein n=1 Tax=Methylobacterium sp. E-041 TaxID=2836573 RepID=UPI001FB8A82E|nr:hypothetical protein [Methylobacterium sp. E-041]MCJ2108177.1 hypothetical protein [Methylobacterium sp. E-041]
MKQETRASRGAMAGLELSAVAADNFVDTAKPLALQASTFAKRYGLPPAVASLVAELALTTPETWRRA